MKAREFRDRTGRLASQIAEAAGISPGYWRQLLTKDLNVPADKVPAICEEVARVMSDLARLDKELRTPAP